DDYRSGPCPSSMSRSMEEGSGADWRHVRSLSVKDVGHSSSAHPIERREATGQYVDQFFPVRRRLPIFAHRDERHVLPDLFLQLGADAPLLVHIGSVQPSGAQLLDAGAGRPTVPARLAVSAQRLVA